VVERRAKGMQGGERDLQGGALVMEQEDGGASGSRRNIGSGQRWQHWNKGQTWELHVADLVKRSR